MNPLAFAALLFLPSGQVVVFEDGREGRIHHAVYADGYYSDTYSLPEGWGVSVDGALVAKVGLE